MASSLFSTVPSFDASWGLICRLCKKKGETHTCKHLVSQATPFAERGRVWSHCTWQVVVEECNYQTVQLDKKMLTSAKHMHDLIATPWQWIQSTKSMHLIGRSNFLPWQHNDQTHPLSAKGVACNTSKNSELRVYCSGLLQYYPVLWTF